MMQLDDALKTSQIAFFVVAGTVAVLTYLKAKKGLLNTVNTEYQKRVIDRLSTVSDELLDEFDAESERYWVKQQYVKKLVERFHKESIGEREQYLAMKEPKPMGTPIGEEEHHLAFLLEKWKTDPFLPKKIRDEVVDLLDNRLTVLRLVHREELLRYGEKLAQGKHWETIDDNWGWIHNKINDQLYQRGCGIAQIQEDVHRIRLEIQKYFESFNPHS